ncbi:MBOAT family O-acyltransferase [Pseudobutyrivibrio xylanivorans]|uniref:D-alanyl-lipoteichoic acid acyltransferase DltB, MBOAT superfamily n=1 Tax=Pseudobutyrivibrio xylanivorans TaxID=185007 RepID=A0A1G5RY11_PSEXY|nr:MBOAT family O-acyltransferase [Pseudobutyrivibrio xylanivorans]SCZ78630.1 D-alanyl-lipoteichoic acid acyltransferase DltB, MBOAT superfamily [Pseudobutyrivibrio xylanivorans]
MLFNSGVFLVFFPIVLIGYYIIPAKHRYIWLLVASYYFYMQWNPIYVLLLLSSTLVTYFGALIIDKNEEIKIRRLCLFISITINLAVLGYFKYSNMFVDYLNNALKIVGNEAIPWDYSIVLPVGISFFTLQALGYLIDVYRGDIYVEKNLLRYALFISFFPQLVAGPIERSKNLLKQLATPKKFNYENLRKGLMIMLYGYFLKVVIADRLAIFVDSVFNNLEVYQGLYVVVAVILFSIQIYCDFYGYSTIAKGVARTMGIQLMDNFNAPYYSKSVKEFWRRWHISLSTWFRDYLYIPLGGNRKGSFRKYLNIMIVFAVSGLWHGASMAFVTWGVLHGLYQLCGALKDCVIKKLGVSIEDTFSIRLEKQLITYLLVCFAWLFFRANNMFSANSALIAMFSDFNWYVLFDQSLYGAGVSREYFIILLMSLVVLAVVDYQKYVGKDILEVFFRQNWIFRTASIMVLLFAVLLYGCYGTIYDIQQFIYFQF